VGAFLSLARGKSKRQLSWFLLTRGLWMIVLELTVSRSGLTFNLGGYGFIGLLVLWSLGCAMIYLAAFIHLPRWAFAILVVALIAGHNLFDGVKASALGVWSWLWIVLHEQGAIPIANRTLFDGYPWIP
jgi:uncharacterized membrane protein